MLPVHSTKPSRTAYGVAVHRARHQVLDEPLVFKDPRALTLLGRDVAKKLRREGRCDDSSWSRAMRAFIVARSRCAEDALAEAVARGVRQYVVLGAGLDTFGYRSSYTALRVFEVDHPATQIWKRELLRASAIAVPDAIQFAPVDFTRDDLTDALARVGFDASQAAFVSWLGVTPYLERSAALSTLRAIAAFPPGSGVTFDYMIDRSLLTAVDRVAVAALAARVAAVGEPFRGYFRPARLRDELRAMGFSRIDDLDRDVLNDRYFHARKDELRIRGSGRVMTAWRCAATGLDLVGALPPMS